MEIKYTEEQIGKVGKKGVKWLRSRHSGWILAVIAFAESAFAPIIIDPFLVALILARRSRWKYYTIIAIVFSVIGGVFAYYMGLLFFDIIGKNLISFYNLEVQFESISTGLNENGFAFVLIGALTPIPYKIVAITSGLLKVSILTFIFASTFGRIVRLSLVGYAAYAVGPHALPMFRRHLLSLAYIFFVLLALYILVRLLF